MANWNRQFIVGVGWIATIAVVGLFAWMVLAAPETAVEQVERVGQDVAQVRERVETGTKQLLPSQVSGEPVAVLPVAQVADTVRTKGRQTGEYWWRRDDGWVPIKPAELGYISADKNGLDSWLGYGEVVSVAGSLVTVEFGSNCQSDFTGMYSQPFTGMVCGTGTFEPGRVELAWQTWDSAMRPQRKQATMADLDAGDKVSVIGPAEAFTSLEGEVRLIVGVQ
jgi:hypothetical protein